MTTTTMMAPVNFVIFMFQSTRVRKLPSAASPRLRREQNDLQQGGFHNLYCTEAALPAMHSLGFSGKRTLELRQITMSSLGEIERKKPAMPHLNALQIMYV
jgi:hypothetical protein